MTVLDLLLTAVALSMDALAVSITTGIALDKSNHFTKALKVGIFFGGFQALMPAIGFFLGTQLEGIIASYDHWVAFGLLVFIGGKMLIDAGKAADGELKAGNPVATAVLFPLAIATSIDAMAVGVSLAMMETNIAFSATLIGTVTLVICTVGVLLGKPLSKILKNRAGVIGGIMLVLIGAKILAEHLIYNI